MTNPQNSYLNETKSSLFRFKRFSIQQQHAAMKIGFDGILLGAWCCVDGYKRFLDVGTGTGLIALMIAQRTESSDARGSDDVQIDAVEIDEAAGEEAALNFERSPWPNQLRLFHEKFQTWRIQRNQQYDLIVCNPPFFSSHVAGPRGVTPRMTPRAVARQTSQLSLTDLFEGADSLLESHGRLCFIVPFDRRDEAIESAQHAGFSACRKLVVRSLPHKPPHRVLLEFVREPSSCAFDEIIIERSHHVYTPEFRRLARDFYLRF